MAARHRVSKHRKMIDDHQDIRVVVIVGANFHMIVSDQLPKVPTLNVFKGGNERPLASHAPAGTRGIGSRTGLHFGACQATNAVLGYVPPL